MTALAVDALTVAYQGARRPAVRDVSMSIDRGEISALVGESGSGKTTLGLAAQRLLPPSASTGGRVEIGGVAIVGGPHAAVKAVRGRMVRYVPQEPAASLNPSRTVGSQLGETLRIHGIGDRRDRHSRLASTLDSVGIPDPELCLTLYPHELSGGMAQRVIIADALLVDPVLIIADEPTASLDATTAVLILSLLRKVATDKLAAVLLITHNIAHALAIGDTINVMYAGIIVESGPVRLVVDEPRMPYTAALLDSRATIARGRARLPVIPGTPGPNPDGDRACVFSARCAYADERCTLAPASTVEAAGGARRTYRCWHPLTGAQGAR